MLCAQARTLVHLHVKLRAELHRLLLCGRRMHKTLSLALVQIIKDVVAL